jgi:hypothetical protein
MRKKTENALHRKPPMTLTDQPTIVIRAATAADGPVLTRLAALDSKRVPFGPTLIAEMDGEPVAAMSLRDGEVVADPFVRTAELVRLLQVHAAAVADTSERSATRSFGFARRLGHAA